MLEMVNETIRDTKSLNPPDTQLGRTSEFVAAGDNPEVRDVQLILTQVLKGQDRFERELSVLDKRLDHYYREAELIADCLKHFVHHNTELDRTEADNGADFSEWFGYDKYFNFKKLDATDLAVHFNILNA